jgi:hypothetical protein
MKISKTIALIAPILIFSLIAKGESKTVVPIEKKDLITGFRCEKFNGSLGDLKLKLIEICNLDKPFSSSLSKTVGGDEFYFYCCHLAK